MLSPTQTNTIFGQIDNIDIEITIRTSAQSAVSSPVVGGIDTPMTHQVFNAATYLATAVNTVLKQMEHGQHGVEPTPSAPAQAVNGPQVIDLSAWKQSLDDAKKGEGD